MFSGKEHSEIQEDIIPFNVEHADMYSFGLLMFTMFKRDYLFGGESSGNKGNSRLETNTNDLNTLIKEKCIKFNGPNLSVVGRTLMESMLD